MILKLISLVNFKNHEDVKLDLSQYVNCFLGNNGVGKTNLLDAIYYLSFCKSYYHSLESNNMRHGEHFFMIKGLFLDKNKELEVDCSVIDSKKKVKFNNKKYTKLSEHIGKVPVVIITPLDSGIILGGGEERRRFIDKILSQLDHNYLLSLISYNRILKQRNTFLKSQNVSSSIDLLSTYDAKLSELGTQIYLKRKECLNMMISNLQHYYNTISKKSEVVDIVYQSDLHDHSLLDLLIKNRKKDQILTFTSSGIHRDDFIFKLNNYGLKKSGSQGQQKTFLIALKFAYFDMLKRHLNTIPILLLDDIFAKLDNERIEQIIRIFNQDQFGQIFITDTDFDRVSQIMSKVNIDCKYFMFNKTGLYEEKFKDSKDR